MVHVPRSQVTALDAEQSYQLGKLICVRGPALITAMPARSTVVIFDGPPWEAESSITDRLTSATLAAGGAWIDKRTFLTATRSVKVQLRLPVPRLMLLRVKRGGAGFTERVMRMLDRIGVRPTGARVDAHTRQLVVALPSSRAAELRRLAAAFGFSVRPVPRGSLTPATR